MAHTAFPYRLIPTDPSVSRMDSVHRCAVAFLWKSHAMRSDAAMWVFFRDGVQQLTSGVRSAFPEGASAPLAVPFLNALLSGRIGSSFGPSGYGSGGILDCVRRMADPKASIIPLDADGPPLHLRIAKEGEFFADVPARARYVVGGTRGFSPYLARDFSSRISDLRGPRATTVSLHGGVQFASPVVAFLQVANENSQLRPAANDFFCDAEDFPRSSVMFDFRYLSLKFPACPC